ncbi:tyrosine-type recombinase/integrase [Candidatus Woesearchaeota archaeon]|nr:tyrosine-type recombinase/integrase [Candidatus Woesearchaeota archaeon]
MNKDEILKKIAVELKIQGKSPRTISTYAFFNKTFFDYIKKDPAEVNEDDVKEFFAYLLSERNYDPASVALAKSALKFFYDEILKKSITKNIKTPKKQRKLPEVLTKEEVKRLIENAGSLRNKLLIEIMYSSGLRVSECAKLTTKEINIQEKTGLIKKGKGGKDRFFILSEKVIEDLNQYLPNVKECLFPGKEGKPITTRAVQRVIERVAKKSAIKKRVYCHGLRHAFATHLLEEGTDIRLIQELLAHANLQTTQFYTRVSLKQLKKVKSPLDT